MKYSNIVIATFGISSITAFPLFERIGSLLEWSELKRHDDILDRSDHDSPHRRETPFNPNPIIDAFHQAAAQGPPPAAAPPPQNVNPGAHVAPAPPSQNTVSGSQGSPPAQGMMTDAFSQIVGGGDVPGQILRVAKDPMLGDDILMFFKTPGNTDKFIAALSNKELLGKLFSLIQDDKLIEDIANAGADGHIGKAIQQILLDPVGWKTISAILKEPRVHMAVHDVLGSIPDIGAFLASQFGRPSITHLMTSIFASFPGGPKWSKGMTALAADSQVQANLHMMMDAHANFGTAFGKTIMDRGFMGHVGQLMGFNQATTDRMNKLVTAGDFPSVALSTAFGSSPPPLYGGVGSTLGHGDVLSTMVHSLPADSFNNIMMRTIASPEPFMQLGTALEDPMNQKIMMAMFQSGPVGMVVRFAVRQVLRRDAGVAMLSKKILARADPPAAVHVGMLMAGIAMAAIHDCINANKCF